MRKLVTLLFALSLGCTSIPMNAAFLSENVNTGIRRMQDENIKVIKALADVERAILNDNWERLYMQVEVQYMGDWELSGPSELTHEDRRRIAATVAQIRQNILDEIKAKEADLVLQSLENRDVVIALNDTVRMYLASLDKLRVSREKAKGLIEEIVGFDIEELKGLVQEKLSGIGD